MSSHRYLIRDPHTLALLAWSHSFVRALGCARGLARRGIPVFLEVSHG